MDRFVRRMLVPAVALLLATTGGLVLAGGRTQAPTIAGAELEPVWGTVFRLSVQVRAERGTITAAEYRAGSDTGALFAADGLLDSADEQVETYVDLLPGVALEVRARAAGSWSDWERVDEPGGDDGRPAGCVLSSEQPGQNGWFLGPVKVDCTELLAAEEGAWLAYSVGFTEWMEADDSFTLEDEGVHWVQVQTVTEEGVQGLPQTFEVAIDATPPEVFLEAPADGSLSHADRLDLDFSAEDELSGVDLVVADVDQEQELTLGTPVNLWELPVGEHSLSVWARDRAGNVAQLEEPLYLEITTDTATLAKLVNLFAAQGRLDGYMGTKQKLLRHLESAAGARGEGNELGERFYLASFVEVVQDGMAEGFIFTAAGNVLVADAHYLIAQLGDD